MLRLLQLFILVMVVAFVACKTSKERQDEVSEHNVLKSYVNEPKDKAMAVKAAVEAHQKKMDIDNYDSGEE